MSCVQNICEMVEKFRTIVSVYWLRRGDEILCQVAQQRSYCVWIQWLNKKVICQFWLTKLAPSVTTRLLPFLFVVVGVAVDTFQLVSFP